MSQLGSHILYHLVDTWVAGMLLERLQQVELRVLLNLDIQVIEGTDRSVAGKEVVRTGTEADDLQVLQTNDGTCDGHELVDHLSTLSGVTYRLLGDIGAGLAE